MHSKRVFSGIQPTGNLHIGNYIGALSLWTELQNNYECLFCIVDLHAITIPENLNKESLRDNVRKAAALSLACGIERSSVFVQSDIREHSELAWILNCVTPMGWLERMTQFKVKSEKTISVGMGLFDYPVLQAADILLYDTDIVPVGEDQKQHIELTRDIAQRFNSLYQTEILKLPDPYIRKEGARIMGLDNPDAKMSKSDTGTYHAVQILDDPDTILKKFSKAVTDSKSFFELENMSAGVQNLVTIIKLMSENDQLSDIVGKGYGVLKRKAAEVVIERLKPVHQRYNELVSDKSELDAILNSGREAALSIAEPKFNNIRDVIGLKR